MFAVATVATDCVMKNMHKQTAASSRDKFVGHSGRCDCCSKCAGSTHTDATHNYLQLHGPLSQIQKKQQQQNLWAVLYQQVQAC